MQVLVDGLLINYEAKGEGKAVLFLHGWADNISNLSSFLSELSVNNRIIAVDLPGFGKSQTPNNVWGLKDYSKFIRSFLTKIDEKDIYAVIGHSNGGAIAINAVSHDLVNADRLVLMASAGIRGVNSKRNFALKIFTKTGKAVSSPLPKSTKRKLRSKLYSSVGSDMMVAEHMQETFKKIVGEDVREDAKKLNLPVLLIYGELDDQTPLEFGELYHQIMTNSTLEVITGAGHFLYLDRPEQVVKIIDGFLS